MPLRHCADVTTAPLASGTPLRLRPPRHFVDPRAITWWRLQSLIFWGVVVIVGAAALLLFFQPLWLILLEAAAVVAGLVDVLVVPRLRYDRHRFETTDQAVYVRNGVFVQDWRVAPLSRVQTVDTKRGPLQQWLGLSTVTVTTASTAGALQIHGLDKEVAAQLVEQLSAATESTPGDAT